jgi:hypothetical protein
MVKMYRSLESDFDRSARQPEWRQVYPQGRGRRLQGGDWPLLSPTSRACGRDSARRVRSEMGQELPRHRFGLAARMERGGALLRLHSKRMRQRLPRRSMVQLDRIPLS